MLYAMEDRIKLVKDFIIAKLPTKLVELAAIYADGLNMPNIDRWSTAELTAVPTYPTGIILGERIETTEQNGYVKNFFVISISCIITDPDNQKLRQRLYRYIRALAEIVYGGQSEIGLNIFLDSADYSPLYGKAGGFCSDARIVIRILKHED